MRRLFIVVALLAILLMPAATAGMPLSGMNTRAATGSVRDALAGLTTKGIVTDARSANADLLFSNV